MASFSIKLGDLVLDFGDVIKLPTTGAGTPSIVNITDPTTGLCINENEIIGAINGAEVLVLNTNYVEAKKAILMPAGSTFLPSVGFADDGDTGMYCPAPDTIGFVAGGTERLSVGVSAVTVTNQLVLPSYTVANLPTGVSGGLVYVTDEIGGATPAHFDGTDWRRVSDNAIVSDV